MGDGDADGSYKVEEDPPTSLSRRSFVKLGALAAGAAWIAAFGGSVLRSLTASSEEGGEGVGKNLVYHVPEGETPWYADMDGEDVLAADFPVGESAKVFTSGTKAILLRFEGSDIVDRAGSQEGFVAYESTCTHLGCQVYFARGSTPVGEYPVGIIYCPCHQGAFDPLRGARVLHGPPPRPLPRIPLRIVDGRLEAE